MNIPVSINEKYLDKYDPTSKYYKDKCLPCSTENGIDLTLYDRKFEYNQKNMSLCPIECQFQAYNNETKKVKCKCEKQINFTSFLEPNISTEELIHKFLDMNKTSNLDVIKCYKLFFSKDGIIYNINSYILLDLILLFIILSILFYYKGFKEIKNIIYKLVNYKKKELNKYINLKEIEGRQIINNNNINLIENKIDDKNLKLNCNINSSFQKRNKKILILF